MVLGGVILVYEGRQLYIPEKYGSFDELTVPLPSDIFMINL